MEGKIGRDINELLGNYSTVPLKVDGYHYGSKFTSERGSVILTNAGMELYSRAPGIIVDSIKRTPKHEKSCSLMSKGMNGDVYKVCLGDEYFAEKRFKTSREDGITQLQDLESIGYGLRNTKNARTPKTFFASRSVLFMEHVSAPTWEDIVRRNPEMEETLMDSFLDGGALEYLMKNRVFMNEDSRLVVEREGKYEFILLDPVRH